MNYLFLGSTIFSFNILEKILYTKLKPKFIISEVKKNPLSSDYDDLSSLKDKVDNFYISKDINNKTTINLIKKFEPDFIIMIGFNSIVSKKILDIPKFGVVGFHPTDLPSNRGNSPIIWSIICDKKLLYSTFFKAGDGIDNGNVILKSSFKIQHNDNATSLYQKLSQETYKNLKIIINGGLYKKPYSLNKDNKSTYWRKRNFNDGIIDWRMSSALISKYIRALMEPYPLASFKYRNRFYRITDFKIHNKLINNNYVPGKIIKILNKNSFIIKTDDYNMTITTLENLPFDKNTNYL